MIHLAFGHHGSPPGATVQVVPVWRGRLSDWFQKMVHVREDPECRLHGVTGRMNIRAPQPQLVPQPPPTAVGGDAVATPPPPSAPTAPSLDRKTHFLTKGGLHLLYEPTAEDRWISRQITTCEEGDYKDNQQRGCGKL